jgi:transposase-like protein
LLTANRNAQAAKRFFRKALSAVHTQEPRVINVDKNAAYPKAIDELKEKQELPEQVELRQNKYLNNIALARPSGDKAISQTRHGIRLIQYS